MLAGDDRYIYLRSSLRYDVAFLSNFGEINLHKDWVSKILVLEHEAQN